MTDSPGPGTRFIEPTVLIGAILLPVFLSVALWAQVKDSTQQRDSLRLEGMSFVEPDVVFSNPIPLFSFALKPETPFEAYLFPNLYPGIPPPFATRPFRPNIDILSPYLLQREREQEMRTFYSILSAVTLGGAAYIAYRHIKEYGFLR